MIRGRLKRLLHAPGVVVIPPPPTYPQYDVSPPLITHTEPDTGNITYSFVITRSVVTTGTGSCDFVITGSGSAPANSSDFAATTVHVTWADGETTKNANVVVLGDTTLEPDEEFTGAIDPATLLPVGSVIGIGSAKGIILNNDTGGGGGGTPQPITLTTMPRYLDPTWSETIAATGWADGVYDIGNGLSLTVVNEVGTAAGVGF